MDTPKTLTCGTQLGPYILERYLGSGAAGQVYEAFEITKNGAKGKRGAVKVLVDKIVQDPQAMHCLRDDLLIYKKFTHRNVGAVHSFGRDEKLGLYFVTMDYIEGRDLNTIINAGILDLGKVCAIFRQILSGLEAAHAQNLLHCDLRPRNVFVDEKLGVKVVNFGMVDLPKDDPNARLEFVAPELKQDSLPNALTDIYSAGVLFRKMLDSVTGGFDQRDPVHQISLRMAAHDPRDRFKSMADVLLEFDRLRGTKAGPRSQAAAAAQGLSLKRHEARDGIRRYEGQVELQKVLKGKQGPLAASPAQLMLLALLAVAGLGVFATQNEDFGRIFARAPKKSPAPAAPALPAAAANSAPSAVVVNGAHSSAATLIAKQEQSADLPPAVHHAEAQAHPAAKINVHSLTDAAGDARGLAALPENGGGGIELVTEEPAPHAGGCGLSVDEFGLGPRASEAFSKISCF